MSSPISRGFRRLRRPSAGEQGRVPPGQYVTQDFPVLSAGPTPHTALPEWTFSIRQGGDTLKSWTWPEFQALSAQTVTVDIHCVTRWSKLDTTWRGIPVDTLLAQAGRDAPYVLAFCDGGYTTNLPVQGRHHGPGVGGLRLRRPAAWIRARRPGPAAGAAPVLLEERQMGTGPGTARSRRTRFLGDLRLPHLRRTVERTAVRGRLTWQVATVTSVIRETGSVRTIGLEVPGWPGHRAGQHLTSG